MISGLGRHRMVNGKFQARADLGDRTIRRSGHRKLAAETADTGTGLPAPGTLGNGLPNNTVVRSFAKPTNMSLAGGLLVDSPTETISLAREMYDNDAVAGAVVDTVCGIPFGNFTLSGMPDREMLKPYMSGMDRIRIKTLLPTLATSTLVDGAFLGTGVFDEKDKCFNAMMPQDLMHAQVTPVPFFGATPIVDINIPPEAARMLHVGMNDERLRAYLKFLPEEFLKGGLVKLQPENTFYIPRGARRADQALGVSLYRKIMIAYLLEKSLARGTIEMAYRRQRSILHVLAGDENWDSSVDEMQDLAGMFMDADLDPLGAVVVTRAGVQVQEIGSAGDFWKWTDNIDILTSLKLKGLGMPDGLLGGDMSLDSVSATLTIFINMIRSFRDYITRAVFYEKMFPYTAIVNNHRRDLVSRFEERSAYGSSRAATYTNHYVERAQDSDVDLNDYVTPTVSWHTSMRPEGDKEYLELLSELTTMGVPIPLRMMAAGGGQDIDDILNGANDDVELRQKVAQYNQQIAALQPQQDDGSGGGGEFSSANPHRFLSPIKRKGVANREYDDRLQPRNVIKGRTYHASRRFREQANEKANRLVASSMSSLAQRMNALANEGRGPLCQHVKLEPTHYSGMYSLA